MSGMHVYAYRNGRFLGRVIHVDMGWTKNQMRPGKPLIHNGRKPR